MHELMFMTFSWFHEAVAELLHSKADIGSAQARPLQVTNCLSVKLCPFSIQDDVVPSWCFTRKLISFFLAISPQKLQVEG